MPELKRNIVQEKSYAFTIRTARLLHHRIPKEKDFESLILDYDKPLKILLTIINSSKTNN